MILVHTITNRKVIVMKKECSYRQAKKLFVPFVKEEPNYLGSQNIMHSKEFAMFASYLGWIENSDPKKRCIKDKIQRFVTYMYVIFVTCKK